MNDSASLAAAIFSIFVLWTTTVVTVVLWLSTKFRSVERLIYSEAAKIVSKQRELETRILRTELRLFGFTQTTEGVELEEP